MRRLHYIVLVVVFLFLAACGANEQEEANNGDNAEGQTQGNQQETTTDESEEQTEDEGSLDVEKGIFSVEVTLPASMFEGQDIETIVAEAEEEGINDVTQNEDGSITYQMSKAKHKEMMQELKTGIDQTINEMKTSEDYVSIKDVTYNESVTEFTLVVEKETYENSMDGFAVFGLGMSGMMYQLYDGANEENSQVAIIVKDEETQEVIDEVLYPDDLEDIE